ncbi:MAG: hypothetical protein HOW73_32390 [Polyangiaceae bacterium]|nr:hypothetical protein [Polyangiaceae bacterium]
MNLGASAIVLRPRTVAEIMDLACRFTFARSLALYLKLSAVFVLPFFAITVALVYILEPTWWVVWAFAYPLSIWLQAPFTLAASRMMFGDKPTVKGVLKSFWSRFGSYTGAMMLKLLYVSLGGALCGIGAFFVAPGGTLVTEASLLEGASAGESWGRSRRLVSQRSTDSFLALMSLVVAHLAFVIGFELFGQALSNEILQIGKPLGDLFKDGVTPFALAGLFFAAPFISTARFLHYIDTRTRADGWDIQVKFMAIVAKHEEAKLQGGRA